MDSYGLLWTPMGSKHMNGFQYHMRNNGIESSYGLLWSHMDSYGHQANEWFSTSQEKQWHINSDGLLWAHMGSYGLICDPVK